MATVLKADTAAQRAAMVDRQLAARGIFDERVLNAMREVPREQFLPPHLAEFAYHDTPLPIAEGQTISQPYVVALMAEAAQLDADDRVLEVGTGSGYAAAVLGRLAGEVVTVERHGALAEWARRRLAEMGADNVRVIHGDGRLGWREGAPYDGVVVTAAGGSVPRPLLDQLADGGRLVVPIGAAGGVQSLRRIVRRGDELEDQDLGPVQFVPLRGGTTGDGAGTSVRAAPETLPQAVRRGVQPFAEIEEADLSVLLDRIGEARLVLIGEASHGTAEFYRMRARITRELIERRGFRFVAAEADWPDAARIDAFVRRGPEMPGSPRQAFSRFPTWMWRNHEVLDFVNWLRDRNDRMGADGQGKVAFYGLDLYSLYESIGEVLRYLDETDPELARVARHRYGCLSPYESDPATYGLATLSDRYRDCEDEVVAMLRDLQEERGEPHSGTGEALFDAVQNARVAANAERYYRAMYHGSAESWNLRDRHMFDTLQGLLTLHGPNARGVVWAHNSHLGDASATEMAARGELNLGQLVREAYRSDAWLIGFGSHAGTVFAADGWDRPGRETELRPSHARSYERVCHGAGVDRFLLPLRIGEGADPDLAERLREPRLERAVGVVYRPESELASHYFEAVLPSQFDEYIWFDRSSALRPLEGAGRAPRLAEGHPLATLDV